jgi:hypothetical protein
LLGAYHHACFAFRAITWSGHSYAFIVEIEHILRAYFETFTVILALVHIYSRKVHA